MDSPNLSECWKDRLAKEVEPEPPNYLKNALSQVNSKGGRESRVELKVSSVTSSYIPKKHKKKNSN